MQTLAIHIEYLLSTRDCVIIPGFGAFLAFRRNARIDESSGKVFPPEREICFNSAITNSDGLLASSIARKERISYEAAAQEVERMKVELEENLKEYGEVSLGQTGSLIYENGRVSFAPRRSAYENSLMAGLGAVPMPGKNEDREVPRREEEIPGGYYHFRISRQAVRIASMIAVVIAVALGIIVPCDFTPRHLPPVKASVIPSVTKSVPAGIRKAAEVPAKAVEPADSSASAGKYHLIVATFRSREDAELFLSQNKDYASHSMRILPGGKRFRVSVESAASRQDLLPLMRDKSFSSRFPGSWIWDGE